jgi:hypothetical protein
MAKKRAPAKRPADVNPLGRESTMDAGPSKDEVSRARAKALTKERRSAIAKAAAKKRWGAKKDPDYNKRIAALIATQII